MADWRSDMRTAPYLFHLEVKSYSLCIHKHRLDLFIFLLLFVVTSHISLILFFLNSSPTSRTFL